MAISGAWFPSPSNTADSPTSVGTEPYLLLRHSLHCDVLFTNSFLSKVCDKENAMYIKTCVVVIYDKQECNLQ